MPCASSWSDPDGLVLHSDDLADIDKVELSACVGVWGVNGHCLAVGAGAGMGIAAPFSLVLRGQIEVTEFDFVIGRDVVEVGFLESGFALGVGIVENPFVVRVRYVGVVAVHGHGFFPDDFDFASVITKDIERGLATFRLGPHADVFRVAPDEVGCVAGGIEDEEVTAVKVGGDHAGGKA